MRSPIVGPAYTARSKDLLNNKCINLYLESVEVPDGAAPNALLGCPGLDLFLTFATSPVRDIVTVGSVIYAIAGNVAYSVVNGVATSLGNIGTSNGPAYILYNATASASPNQIAFFDASGLWVWTPATSTFAPVVLPFTGTVGVPTYLDGLGLVTQPGTFNIWQSNVNDLTTWNALNFTTEDGNSEPVVALASLHDQVLVFKQYSFVPYVNAGLNGFVFQRLQGVYPEVGVIAPQSVFTFGDAAYWVGQVEGGGPKIYMTGSYTPEEISTSAIENAMANYPTVSDAWGFGYSQEGHDFAVFSFPSAGETWVFDLKESRRMKAPVWHQRALFSAGAFTLYPGIAVCQVGGAIYMGDYSSGNLYTLNLRGYPLDNGAPRKWLRSWRATAQPSGYVTEKCNFLDLQMETGIGVPAGTNPQLVLRQSFDGGSTWSSERYTSAGVAGQTQQTVRFRRFGPTRRGLNSDRTFELSSTDRLRVAILGAEIG